MIAALRGRYRHLAVSQVGRILAGLELAPHRVRGWLNRRDDEQFWAQAAAVCELYLRPPPGTVVICIDEKTGIQAKYRKYPEQPPGRAGLPAGSSSTSATAPSPSSPRCTSPPGRSSPSRSSRNNSATFTGFLHRLDQCIDPRPAHSPGHGQRVHPHLPGHPGLDRRAPPDHRHLHPEARLLAGHGRAMVLRADPRPAAPRRVHLPRRPRRQDHRLHHPAQPGPPGPAPGPTTPAPTTPATSPAMPSPNPCPPSPKLHDRSPPATGNPARNL